MKDFHFSEKYIKVNVKRSKTDVYNSGSETVIFKTYNRLCPVSWLRNYIAAAGLVFTSTQYLFSKSRYAFAYTSVPISYTRARETLLEAINSVGENASEYGLHSLRSGGASAFAISGADTDGRLLCKHGRWKSSMSADIITWRSVFSFSH